MTVSEDRISQLDPLRRNGEPIEIADAIAVRASDVAGFINGQALVGGGVPSSHPFSRPRRIGEAGF